MPVPPRSWASRMRTLTGRWASRLSAPCRVSSSAVVDGDPDDAQRGKIIGAPVVRDARDEGLIHRGGAWGARRVVPFARRLRDVHLLVELGVEGGGGAGVVVQAPPQAALFDVALEVGVVRVVVSQALAVGVDDHFRADRVHAAAVVL